MVGSGEEDHPRDVGIGVKDEGVFGGAGGAEVLVDVG